jgi:hypothetical protein
MNQQNLLPIEFLKPAFLDSEKRYNNYFFTVGFELDGAFAMAKFSVTEGTLRGQTTKHCLSRGGLVFREEEDTTVLLRSDQDLNLKEYYTDIDINHDAQQVSVNMGHIAMTCRSDGNKITSDHPALGADLTFTPRGPVHYWGNSPGADCQVTPATRIQGMEVPSLAKGSIVVDGKSVEIDGAGVFEHVWFNEYEYMQIRLMNWTIGHLDKATLFISRTDSADQDGTLFAYHTGGVFLEEQGRTLSAGEIDVKPQKWVFMQEARRFIPLAYETTVQTEEGVLSLQSRLAHYPQLLAPPMRLEDVTLNGITGWAMLAYDVAVEMEGKFSFADGTSVSLGKGQGVHEMMSNAPL